MSRYGFQFFVLLAVAVLFALWQRNRATPAPIRMSRTTRHGPLRRPLVARFTISPSYDAGRNDEYRNNSRLFALRLSKSLRDDSRTSRAPSSRQYSGPALKRRAFESF